MRVSDDIKQITPYSPGKPVEELERELGIRGSVKLASNENPLGPSQKALAAMAASFSHLHRYPDGAGYRLKVALSERLGVTPAQIILGNGSNEIIELIVRTFMVPGDEAIMADLTFVVYRTVVMAAHGRPVIVPLKEARHDLAGMGERITPRTRVIFIANPNNPTGTIVTREEVADFMKRVPAEVIVVFDEAYREYVMHREYPDSREYLEHGRNVVSLRTFSKIYGLAGLRIGYGVAKEEMVDYMNRVRQPFNTNALAQAGALAAMSDEDHVAKSIRLNNEGKEFLYRAFDRMGIRYIPTEANFIFFDAGSNGRDLYEQLLREGVIIRYIEGRWVRVTIGLPEENKRFIEALQRVRVRMGEQDDHRIKA